MSVAHDAGSTMGKHGAPDADLCTPAELSDNWSMADCCACFLAHHRMLQRRSIPNVEPNSAPCGRRISNSSHVGHIENSLMAYRNLKSDCRGPHGVIDLKRFETHSIDQRFSPERQSMPVGDRKAAERLPGRSCRIDRTG